VPEQRQCSYLRAARCALRPTSAQIPPPRRCSPSPFAGVGVVSGVGRRLLRLGGFFWLTGPLPFYLAWG